MNPWQVRRPGKGRGIFEWESVRDQALRSYGYERGGLAQCICLSSCTHWGMDLLCTIPGPELQVPCSAPRHWPASTLSTSTKAAPTSHASWAAGEEKRREEKGLES